MKAARPRALFGGTFDPVHLGHLHAARVGLRVLNVSKVTLLPAARPWHRAPPVASALHRWRMLCLATRGEVGLAASDLEILRPGPSYTVATLAELAGAKPLVWCIGRDAVDAIASWHRASELPALCHLLVFERPAALPGSRSAGPESPAAKRRPGPGTVPKGFEPVDDAEDLATRASGCIHYMAQEMLDISASEVRRTIAAGGNAGALLPWRVWAYIRRHGLYGARLTKPSTDQGSNEER